MIKLEKIPFLVSRLTIRMFYVCIFLTKWHKSSINSIAITFVNGWSNNIHILDLRFSFESYKWIWFND